MKRPTFNAELLKHVSSQKEMKQLLLKIKSNTQKLSYTSIAPAALIISALKSKIKKSLYVIVEESGGTQDLARLCVPFVGLSVYEIKKLNLES